MDFYFLCDLMGTLRASFSDIETTLYATDIMTAW